MAELTDIVGVESPTSDDEKLSGMESVGFSLCAISATSVLAYAARFTNDIVLDKAIKLPEIVEKVSYHAGDFAHIWGPYWLAGVIEGKESRKYSNIVLGLTTAYHTLGEIFNSSIAPNLPQILPGTPDPLDIPVAVLLASGMYLMNKKRVIL